MKKIALYRKYRPFNFENLMGQEHVKTTLINSFKNHSIAHAYLFAGPRGTGKTTTARLVAKALNCSSLKDGFEPCDECDFCKDINDGRLIDIIEIDAASNRGIDEVRDLKEKINFAPTSANFKVYIIDEVHMMTKEAFNALLKTLEEPPSHAYFILATTEIHKIPETIISRCQRFDFKRISDEDLVDRLKFIAEREGLKVEDKALLAISKYARGGLRDAIGILEQLSSNSELKFDHVKDILGISDCGVLEDFYVAIQENNSNVAIRMIQNIYSAGSNLRQFAHDLVEMLRMKMLFSVESGEFDKVPRLIEIIEAFQNANLQSDLMIPQLPFEIAIIRLTGNFSGLDRKGFSSDVGGKDRVHKAPIGNSAPADQSVVQGRQSSDLAYRFGGIWSGILENIKNPALRISAKNSTFAGLEGSNFKLEFSTKFHMDKVMEHDHRIELESLLKDALKKEIKIISSLKSLDIKPLVTERPNGSDLASEALDIFGGELI